MRTEDGWRTVELTHRCGRESLLGCGRNNLLWSSTGADAEHARPVANFPRWTGIVNPIGLVSGPGW